MLRYYSLSYRSNLPASTRGAAVDIAGVAAGNSLFGGYGEASNGKENGGECYLHCIYLFWRARDGWYWVSGM